MVAHIHSKERTVTGDRCTEDPSAERGNGAAASDIGTPSCPHHRAGARGADNLGSSHGPLIISVRSAPYGLRTTTSALHLAITVYSEVCMYEYD